MRCDAYEGRAGMTSGSSASDDSALIEACQAGDERAWSDLVRRYRRLIYSIPVGYRLSPTEADDIFQSVVTKLFRHIPSIRQRESIAAWLAVTTRRECQAWLRTSRRWKPLEEGTADDPQVEPLDVASAIHEVECQHTLALALTRLEQLCRTLLGALYLEEPTPSYDELAQRLGRPIGSLGPTRSRCLKKLRQIYSDLGGAEP